MQPLNLSRPDSLGMLPTPALYLTQKATRNLNTKNIWLNCAMKRSICDLPAAAHGGHISSAAFSGDCNQGFQLAYNSGHVDVRYQVTQPGMS